MHFDSNDKRKGLIEFFPGCRTRFSSSLTSNTDKEKLTKLSSLVWDKWPTLLDEAEADVFLRLHEVPMLLEVNAEEHPAQLALLTTAFALTRLYLQDHRISRSVVKVETSSICFHQKSYSKARILHGIRFILY